MKIKKLLKDFHITLASIITTFFVATVLFTFAAWQNPTQAPPGGNVDAPINIGPTAQTKTGGGITLDLQATNNPALTVTSSGLNWGSGIQFRSTTGGGRTYGIYSGPDAQLHFQDVSAGTDRLSITPTQVNIFGGVGTAVGLTVTGSSDFGPGIQLTNTGSSGRTHRIFSGSDGNLHFLDVTAARERLTLFPNWVRINDAGGTNVGLRVNGRIRSDGGGLWVDSAESMFVGAVDVNNIGLFGNAAGFGLSMNKTTGNVSVTALCLSGVCRSAWPASVTPPPPSVVDTIENIRIVRGTAPNILCDIGPSGCGNEGYSVGGSGGSYTINFTPCFLDGPVFVATPQTGSPIATVRINSRSNCAVGVVTQDTALNTISGVFDFIAIGKQ